MSENNKKEAKNIYRFLAPVLLIVIGVLALLSAFGIAIVSIGFIATLLWPLILIGIGIGLIWTNKNKSWIVGIILILIGVFYLIGSLIGAVTFLWRMLWPVILIAIGGYLFYNHSKNKNQNKNSTNNETVIEGKILSNKEDYSNDKTQN